MQLHGKECMTVPWNLSQLVIPIKRYPYCERSQWLKESFCQYITSEANCAQEENSKLDNWSILDRIWIRKEKLKESHKNVWNVQFWEEIKKFNRLVNPLTLNLKETLRSVDKLHERLLINSARGRGMPDMIGGWWSRLTYWTLAWNIQCIQELTTTPISDWNNVLWQ